MAWAITVPVLVGLNVTWHVAAVVFNGANVQGAPVKDPVAVPELVNPTVPEGTEAPEAMSFTVAVQVVPWLITIVDGAQDTAVLVA